MPTISLRSLSLVTALVCSSAMAGQFGQSGRVRQRFDANWQFQKESPSKRSGSDFQWSWRPATGVSLATASLPADIGVGTSWSPAKIGEDVFHGRVGFAWFKTDLGRGQQPANMFIHFESVDDNAVVFLNGHRLKSHEVWNDPFDVPLGADWKPDGPNEIEVLVENTAAGGGVSGSVWLDVPHARVAPPEAEPGYNDKAWRTVHLPHDYVVEGTFEPASDPAHGSLPLSTAWYRKTFTLPASDQGKSLWIDFDGVYRDSTVYLNGHELGNWPGGYAGFRYDITKWAHVGGENVIAVHVDPRRIEGWWYEGGGIYRHVWLTAADPLHVEPWGVAVRTDIQGPEGTPAPTDVRVTTAILNDRSEEQSFSLTSRVIDPSGKSVATATQEAEVPGNARATIDQTAHVPSSILWSIESPKLYKLETTVTLHGKVVDTVTTPFGIRTLRWDAAQGFFLNGKSVKLKGTCNHQDFAGVGIALTDGLFEWRVRKLKEMGSNAYRCSHNPPAPELLDACDRLGMVVMDETRHFGDTESAKSNHGVKAVENTELKAMVLRDRNHPSVIMWSLANEEWNLQATPEGAQVFAAMRKAVLEIDPTRPCSSAMNGGQEGQGISRVEDLIGFNYNPKTYDHTRAMFQTMPMFGSETGSTVTTRGEYTTNNTKGYVAAYDVQDHRADWGNTAEDAWRPIAERPWMAGAFVWTGFDYKGEPTPYAWPCVNSHFGIMDLCGFPKDNYYYYQAWWGDKPIVHLLPHWNWAGNEGKPIDVWAYSNAEEVELLLNGKSLGSKKMPAYGHVNWSVPYQPGTLEARATKAGRVIATDRVVTTGAPAALRLKTTRRKITADGEDVTVVEVSVVDAAGHVVPTASDLVSFGANGPARIVGVGNGDPSSHEPDVASNRHAFNGLCMALVGRATAGGSTTFEASAPGLKSATLTIDATSAATDH